MVREQLLILLPFVLAPRRHFFGAQNSTQIPLTSQINEPRPGIVERERLPKFRCGERLCNFRGAFSRIHMKVGCEGHCGVDLIISKVDLVAGVTIASFG